MSYKTIEQEKVGEENTLFISQKSQYQIKNSEFFQIISGIKRKQDQIIQTIHRINNFLYGGRQFILITFGLPEEIVKKQFILQNDADQQLSIKPQAKFKKIGIITNLRNIFSEIIQRNQIPMQSEINLKEGSQKNTIPFFKKKQFSEFSLFSEETRSWVEQISPQSQFKIFYSKQKYYKLAAKVLKMNLKERVSFLWKASYFENLMTRKIIDDKYALFNWNKSSILQELRKIIRQKYKILSLMNYKNKAQECLKKCQQFYCQIRQSQTQLGQKKLIIGKLDKGKIELERFSIRSLEQLQTKNLSPKYLKRIKNQLKFRSSLIDQEKKLKQKYRLFYEKFVLKSFSQEAEIKQENVLKGYQIFTKQCLDQQIQNKIINEINFHEIIVVRYILRGLVIFLKKINEKLQKKMQVEENFIILEIGQIITIKFKLIKAEGQKDSEESLGSKKKEK